MPHTTLELYRGRCGCDVGEFAQAVRRLAVDAHQLLKSPDCSPDDLIVLHSRVFRLIEQAPCPRSAPIVGWLWAVRETIGERLCCWREQALELRVA